MTLRVFILSTVALAALVLAAPALADNAAGSIAIVVPALVVIFLNRYLVTGLLAGSVK